MKKISIIILLFVTCYLYLINKAGQSYNTYVPGDYHSTLHADAAGYNVYLPAISPYSFKGKFPDKQDESCGYGFTLDKDKKVITKYNYGVAFLQSPFYFAGMMYAKLAHKEFTGYGPFNQKLVDWAGIFYGLLGLFILFFFLRTYFNIYISSLSVLILFLSFNVLWYVVIQPGMSHVYSFFLFSLLLFSTQQYYKKQHLLLLLLICFSAAFIVLIRPLNALFLPIIFFIPNDTFLSLKERCFLFFNIKKIIIAGICAAIVLIPQLIYWKFAYGEYLPDTYPNESFTNIWNPQLIELFFAAKSGLIPYNPIYIIIIPLLIYYAIRRKEPYFKVSLAIFIILSYLCAAWYEYFFGCGLANRNFMEYSVLLVFPIAQSLQSLSKNKVLLVFYVFIVSGCAAINIKLTESFDMCFFGKDIWDYSEYNYLLMNHYEKLNINFEDSSKYYSHVELVKAPHDKNNTSSKVDAGTEFASVVSVPVKDLGYITPRKIELSMDVYTVKDNLSSEVVVQIMRNNEQIFFQAMNFTTADPIWDKFSFFASLPADMQKTDKVLIFIWNRGRRTFYVDNYQLKCR